MPLINPRAVHLDSVLTNISVGYYSSQTYLSTSIFPRIPVQKQSNEYRVYPKSTFYRAGGKVRAPGTESAGINMQTTLGHYYADTRALHYDIDDDTRANCDSDLNLDRDGTILLTQAMTLGREMDFASTYLQPGVWGKDFTPATKWSADGSDPIQDVNNEIAAFTMRNGVAPNVAVAGLNVHTRLLNHPAIIDRTKYTSAQSVTIDILKNLFNLKGSYLVGDAVASPEVNSILTVPQHGEYGNPDDVQLEAICPDIFALFYVPTTPGLLTPSPGYTFNWTARAGGANDIAMFNYRLNKIKSDRFEAEMAYDQRPVCFDLGEMFNSVL